MPEILKLRFFYVTLQKNLRQSPTPKKRKERKKNKNETSNSASHGSYFLSKMWGQLHISEALNLKSISAFPLSLPGQLQHKVNYS